MIVRYIVNTKPTTNE